MGGLLGAGTGPTSGSTEGAAFSQLLIVRLLELLWWPHSGLGCGTGGCELITERPWACCDHWPLRSPPADAHSALPALVPAGGGPNDSSVQGRWGGDSQGLQGFFCSH